MQSTEALIAAHEASGRYIEVDDLRIFVREQGTGEAVICFHGVPTSSFLYRKVIEGLAEQGMKGISFDLPGLGFSDRPQAFDYTWTGLAAFSVKVIMALRLEKFHLVVHDLGGPVGLEMATHFRENLLSLTILNTIVEPHRFRKPWSMAPFAMPLIDRLWLGSINDFLFVFLMRLQGIYDKAAVSKAEIIAHLHILRQVDRGKAFLKIMKGFEQNEAKSQVLSRAIKDVPYPVQLVWCQYDPAIPMKTQGATARKLAGGDEIIAWAANHCLPAHQPTPIGAELPP